MDTTLQLARAVVAAVRAVNSTVEVWAGEVGPHNGVRAPHPPLRAQPSSAKRRPTSSLFYAPHPPQDGGPGDGRLGNCSGNKVCGRFGSTLWYADAMASKAVAGYAAFCRQDLVGADYGLLNFTTLAPATDYWLLLLWKRLIGARVLSVSAPPANPAVRAYAFCGARAPGTVALLLVHLGAAPACVDPPAIADPAQPRVEYALTPTDGTVESAGVALNGGAPLALGPGGALPPLSGRAAPAATPITLAPLSVTIVEFAAAAAGACA